MVFSSIFFIFVFLPVTLALYYIAPKKIKNFVLLLCSLVFYSWGEPVYVILMLLNIVFNYILGIDIEASLESGKSRRAKHSLIFALIVNLSLLGFFKYYGFVIDNLNHLPGVNINAHEIGLPIGISFYTFQVLSYIIDIYRGRISAQKNIINLGVYVTMFPQLIAGPIVQYKDIESQLTSRKISMTGFCEGAKIFILGLSKKVFLANSIGAVFDNLSAVALPELSVLSAWLICISYTFQIYFDFSGYSDMAIGLGKMLGFDFLPNFNYPYISKSATEFWRRWHISLGSWFRDYVYIPLGGNMVSPKRHIINILIVWMLTGLWHGASWNFVAWGLYYGLILIFEKYFLMRLFESKIPAFILHIYTMLVVMIGWVIFSSPNLSTGFSIILIMFGFGQHALTDSTGIYYIVSNLILIYIMVLACTPCLKKLSEHMEKLWPRKSQYLLTGVYIILLLICISYLVNDTYNPFLYFRF